MTTWARAGLNTYLRHDFAVFPGSDHWAQVDVWIPQLDPCPNPNVPGLGFLPFFLRLAANNGLNAASTSSPVPNWHWAASGGNQASPGPAAATTYTVGYHVHGGTFDWYIDGVLVISEPLSGGGGFSFLTLNLSFIACCCMAVYYTNVLVGTAQGAGDLFADDFSGGNFNNWYTVANQTNHPVVASLVGAPTANPCPTLSVSPARGKPGSPMHVTGSGFTPGPVTVWWGGNSVPTAIPVENVSPVADGFGSLAFDMEVPQGVGSDGTTGVTATPDIFYVIDSAKLVGCANFAVCSANNSDGIRADVDGDGFDTNTPNPLVALGGVQSSEGSGSGFSNTILDYVFHDGSHWVLWTDPSVSSRSANTTTFPPPTNHTLNATRISADGSSVEDFPMDTNYAWLFGSGNDDDPGLFDSWPVCGFPAPIWSRVSYFSSWQKPVYDARFASDGDTLWVGLVTAESVPYPWIDNKDAHSINPGGASQATPLATLTSGFTSFARDTSTGYLRYYNNPTGPIDFFESSAFPLTDAGINGMGVWNPPVVVMFAFNGGGFDRIGEVAAKYCPSVIQQTDGYQNQGGSIIGGILAVNTAPNGSLFGRVALAASKNNPGVCHVVWSEGGDWGRVSDGAPCTTGPYGGSRFTWDAGPAHRSYRVNHTTWSPTAKLADTDIFESHIDRTNWWFPYSYGGFFNNLRNGYTWPVPGEFAGLITYDLRCDNANGDVLLFVSNTIPFQGIFPPNGNPDPDGHPWLDNFLLFNDTLYVYEISGGTAVLKQSIDGSLFPNATECNTAYPPNPLSGQPDATPIDHTSDCLLAVPAFDPDNGKPLSGVSPQDKAFGISDIYEDPLLDGLPVYLVHVPWARRTGTGTLLGSYGIYPMRAFYRVPADMSGPFEFLDGDRQAGFTVLGGALSPSVNGFGGRDRFGSGDFFSDPHNIWCPTTSGPALAQSGSVGVWFDRLCKNQWGPITDAETPGRFITDTSLFVGYNTCPGFHYDPDADSITLAAPPKDASHPAAFAVEILFICRGCSHCRCGRGLHIAHRF